MAISLSGLDLPWLQKDRACKPGRYVCDTEAGVIPASVKRRERAIKAALIRGTVACPELMPDIDSVYGGAWKSVIDGSVISSRSNRREMEIRNSDGPGGPIINVGDRYWSEDGDDIRRTEELMGYDKSLIGKDFHWGKDDPTISD